MMKLAIFLGVFATCALSASVVDYKKRAELEKLEDNTLNAVFLEKRGNNTDNNTDCFVCPSYREQYNPPCYPMSWVCDGYKDCPSGLDEHEKVCGEWEAELDEILGDIAENAGEILGYVARQLVTDDYEFLVDVYDETRDAAEKINDVIEEAMEEFN